MGGLAITTLAGTELLLVHHRSWLRDVDLTTWALAGGDPSARRGRAASPALALRGGARWSFVFPLGMYAVASRVLGGAEDLSAPRAVGAVFFGIALAAWLLTAAGLARRIVNT
jgi:Voltage-dependent anion channel